MSVNRQICRVIESEAVNRKILIELNGKLLKTEKILGLDFRPGDYACFQTYDNSEKSLVVALNPDELLAVRLKKETDDEDYQNDIVSPISQIIPHDQNVFIEKQFGLKISDFSRSLNKDLIKDPFIINRLKVVFENVIDEQELDKGIKDIFPIIAIQSGVEFEEMKKEVYKKADEVLCRKLVNVQTNRDVHKYLMERIDRITNEKDHDEFFKSLGYYLDRLRKIQKEKSLSSSNMGVIFYPIYSHYLKRFKREGIDNWIQLRANNNAI